MKNFEQYIITKNNQINTALEKYLPRGKSNLIKAMRYSMFAGGKRFRPVLMLAVAESLKKPIKNILPAACAMEMMHTFTLVHDDLPAMDNADLRRGRPTCHKVFGEDIAVLAGDALLNEAFLLLVNELPADLAAASVKIFAEAMGTDGVCEGQVRDLEAEGEQLTIKELSEIHKRKTGALLEGAVMAAACIAGATKKQKDGLRQYARSLGLVFQIRDDILDATASSAELGKNPSDLKLDKQTYVKLLGVAGATRECEKELKKAKNAVSKLGLSDTILTALVEFAAARNK